jgi:PilZ domain
MDQPTASPQDTLSRTALALVDESAVEMTTETGDTVEVWTIGSDGDTVRASAPRLQVRTGMLLSCRIMIDDTPHHVTVLTADAAVSSSTRAALLLRVVESSSDGVTRRSERSELHLPAVVTALVCDRIVPDEPLSAVITDVSEGGLAISIADFRVRVDDRLRLQVRVFEGKIDCELRVRSVRPGPNPGNQVIGCSYLAYSAATADIIGRWIDRVTDTSGAVSGASIREALGILPEDPEAEARPAVRPRLRPAWQF